MSSNTELAVGVEVELEFLPTASLRLIGSKKNGQLCIEGEIDLVPGFDLAELLDKLMNGHGPALPLSVTRLGLAYTSLEDFRWTLKTLWGAKQNPATLDIIVSKREGSFVLGGELELGGLRFDVFFDQSSAAAPSGEQGLKASSTGFVATMAAPATSPGSPVPLRSMLSSLDEEVAWVPELPLAVRHGLFAYRSKKGDAGKQSSSFIFSVMLDMDTASMLSRLPLFGQELTRPGTELSLRGLELLVASRRFDEQEVKGFTDALVSQAQERLGPGPSTVGSLLPGGTIEAGVRLSAKLMLGSAVLELPPIQLGATPAVDQTKTAPSQGGAPRKPPPAAPEKVAAGEGYQLGPLFLKKVDVAFDSESSTIKLQLTGGVRLANFQLELINAGVSVPLDNLSGFQPFLGGLALSFKAGPVSVIGAFMKMGEGARYGGLLRIDLTMLSIAAMGLYEELPSSNDRGRVTSLFIYGALSMVGGAGIVIGPIKLTGLALALGLNRRLTLPSIEKVADFPLVKMVMAKSAQDLDPGTALKELGECVVAEYGQYFGCLGVRFSIAATIDCFALGSVQLGTDGLEIALLGLARYERENLCFVELALKGLLRPSEGLFLAQAQVTGDSWVLDRNCRLTGGFAIAFWFSGANKGDFVVCLGGYHPGFKKPDHYPVVPRLGLNWQLTEAFSIKGELYCAVTPSVLMVGGRLEAAYRGDSVSARFVAYLNLLMDWAPVHYALESQVAISVQVKTWVQTINLSLSVAVSIWGPPFGGKLEVDLSLVSFTLEFKPEARNQPSIGSWAEFAGQFVDKGTRSAVSTADDPGWMLPGGMTSAPGPALFQLNLSRGELIRAPASVQNQPGKTSSATSGNPDGYWYVRGDELELAASTAVPVTSLLVGQLESREEASGIPGLNDSGRSLVVKEPVRLGKLNQSSTKGAAVGIRPMKLSSLTSTLAVTVVSESTDAGDLDLSQWDFDVETTALPGALWDTATGAPSLDARLINGCIVGLRRLRPPAGKYLGQALHIEGTLPPADLEPVKTPRRTVSPDVVPGAQAVAVSPAERAQRQEQTAKALEAWGFKLSSQVQ